MASNIVYTWKVFCQTEGNSFFISQKHKPTACPNDAAHTIDTAQTSYTTSPATPIFNDPTKNLGYYKTKGVTFSCAANTTTTFNVTFPYDIILTSAYLFGEDENQGDILNIKLIIPVALGQLVSDTAMTGTSFTASDTIIDRTVKGMILNFGDSNDYIAKTVDLNTSLITVTPPFAAVYTAGTYVTGTANIVDTFQYPSKNIIRLGTLNPSPVVIKSGFTIRFLYTNNTGSTKTCNNSLDFY